jgi:enamine deaminase RidA (YjgF/YER057c/UK114 family)
MTPEIDYINPTALPSPNGFTHVTVGAPARLVFVSGQVAYGEDGAVVGSGDLAAQAHQVFVNLSRALESAGSDFEHVLKLTFFVKDISEEAVATIRQVRKTFLVSSRLPASTMVGVAGLAKEALLLEVEAYAMQRSRA